VRRIDPLQYLLQRRPRTRGRRKQPEPHLGHTGRRLWTVLHRWWPIGCLLKKRLPSRKTLNRPWI
jgi:hypothetical protein